MFYIKTSCFITPAQNRLIILFVKRKKNIKVIGNVKLRQISGDNNLAHAEQSEVCDV